MNKLMAPLSGQYDPDHPANLEAPALRAAFEVARGFDAHAEVVSIVDPPAESIKEWPFWLPGGGAAAVCDMIDEASEVRRRHARRQFEAVLADLGEPPPVVDRPTPGYSTRIVERSGEIRATVAHYGKLCDLLVVASSDMMWLAPFTPIIEACFTQTGRPVLLAPPEMPEHIGARVAVGWDGSVAATRAVAAAMPFLHRADEILVVSCEESKKPSPRGESLAEFLAWHGLEAGVERITAPSRAAGEELFDRAIARDCDLIVLGARVHTRAHRLLFGSVTEYALDEPRLAVFFGP